MVKSILKKLKGEKFDVYREEVQRRNYINLQYFAVFGTLIILLINLMGLAFNKIITFNTEFLIIGLYFAIFCIFAFIAMKHLKKYTTIAFYLSLTPIMIMGILLGTFLDPTQPSITIMILMCALPVFILDKPWRIIMYITIVAAVYSVCCYFAKDIELFKEDIVDAFIYYLIAVGVNVFILFDRIDCVENFINYRDKSEKDLLTGVYNRGTGVEKMEEQINNRLYGAFIMIDVDDFKQVNDKYGHINGDNVLKKISRIITDSFEENDIVFRMGGDEFAVYAAGLVEEEECIDKFNTLFSKLQVLKAGFSEDYKFSISLGCSFYSSKINNFKELYRNSDETLYEAKKSGKGCYRITV